jgi:WD40 repeat protein
LLSSGELTWNDELGGFEDSAELAVPVILKDAFPHEPLWVDVRSVRLSEHLSLRNAAFRSAIVGLSAALLNRERDELDGEDLRRHRFTIRLAWVAILLLITSTVIAIGNSVSAIHERNDARTAQGIAIEARNTADAANKTATAQRNQAIQATAAATEARDHAVAANSRALAERDRAVAANRQRSAMLSRAYLETGLMLLQNQNVPDAALWFAHAVDVVKGDATLEKIPRMYLTSALRDLTVPEHILYHDGPVHYVAISKDGARIATAGDDRTARVWDRDGSPLTPPMPHSGTVRYVDISPDGKIITTATQSPHMVMPKSGRLGEIFKSLVDKDYSPPAQDPDNPGNTAMVWDLATAKPVTQAVGFAGPVLTSNFVPNGNVMSVFDGAMTMPLVDTIPWDVRTSGHSARIWNSATGKDMAYFEGVNTMALSPDARNYAVGATDGRTYIGRDGMQDPIVIKQSGPVVWVGFTSDGKKLLTLSDNNEKLVDGKFLESKGVPGTHLDWNCQVWDAETGKDASRGFSTGKINDARVVRFSPDGSRVAVARSDGGVEIWSMTDLKQLASNRVSSTGISIVELSADNERLLVASERTVQVWDAHKLKPLTRPIQHESTVLNARFGPGKDQIITASGCFADGRTGSARIWDIEPRLGTRVSLRQDVLADGIAFSPDRKSLLTWASGEKARIVDLNEGAPVTTIDPRGHLTGAFYTMDGLRILTTTKEGRIQVWNVHGEEIGPDIEGGSVAPIAFSPNGRMVAVVAGSKAPPAIRLWDLRAHRPVSAAVPLKGEHGLLSQFSPGGMYLLTVTGQQRGNSALSGGIAQIWRIENNQLSPVSTLADVDIRSAEFSADSTRIATTDSNGALNFWAPTSGTRIGSSTNLGGRVFGAEFLPDSNRILLTYATPGNSYEEVDRGWLSSPKLAQLWDASARLPLGPPIHSDGFARFLQSSSDGSFVAGARDQYYVPGIQFWDLTSGKTIGSGWEFPSGFRVAALSSDENTLAVTGSDKVIQVFDLHNIDWPADDLIALTELISGNKLSEGGYLKPVTAREQSDLLQTIHKKYPQWFVLHTRAGSS